MMLPVAVSNNCAANRIWYQLWVEFCNGIDVSLTRFAREKLHSSLHCQCPFSGILNITFERVGESCQGCTIKMAVIANPAYIHNLSRHNLHLGIVTWKHHETSGSAND